MYNSQNNTIKCINDETYTRISLCQFSPPQLSAANLKKLPPPDDNISVILSELLFLAQPLDLFLYFCTYLLLVTKNVSRLVSVIWTQTTNQQPRNISRLDTRYQSTFIFKLVVT